MVWLPRRSSPRYNAAFDLGTAVFTGRSCHDRGREVRLQVHLWPLEHQHRRRPVRPAGPQGSWPSPRRSASTRNSASTACSSTTTTSCPTSIPWTQSGIEKAAAKIKKLLDGEGLFCEFVAPRLWEHPNTVDGGYTSNSAAEPQVRLRPFAADRGHRQCPGLPRTSSCGWPAKGTYIREAKDPIASVGRIVDAINALLEYDKNIRVLGEMKPNEPMDQAYLPTPGHFMALCYRTAEPSRVGVLIESAHSILAGLDPSDDMAYALWHGKLWSVHLNDQNGLKYDQDKIVRLGGPAAGVQPGLGAGAGRLPTAASAST